MSNPSPLTAVHGQYSEWGTWSNCSVSCGEGIQSRDRECDSPAPSSNGLMCSGNPEEKMTCTTEDCEGK